MEGGFELVRRADGVRHRFEHVGERNGRPRFRREDGAVDCCWLPPTGWCTVDGNGVENGWPLTPMSRPARSQGRGAARRPGKSYLDDLVPVESTGPS